MTIPVKLGGTGAISAPSARTNLGLGNVDNTSDVDKTRSTNPIGAVLANKADLVNGKIPTTQIPFAAPTVGTTAGTFAAGNDSRFVSMANKADLVNGKVPASQLPSISAPENSLYVTLTNFGADPTGATDSAGSFQRAWNALKATGGTIMIPPGRYIFNSQEIIALPDVRANENGKTIKIVGAGMDASTLHWPNPNGGLKLVSGHCMNSLHVSDFTVTTGCPDGGEGILFYGTDFYGGFKREVPLCTMNRIKSSGYDTPETDAIQPQINVNYWSRALSVRGVYLVSWYDCVVYGAAPNGEEGTAINSLRQGKGIAVEGMDRTPGAIPDLAFDTKYDFGYGLLYNVFGGQINTCDIGFYYGDVVQGVNLYGINFGYCRAAIETCPDPSKGVLAQLYITNCQSGAGTGTQVNLLAPMFTLGMTNCTWFLKKGCPAGIYMKHAVPFTIIGSSIQGVTDHSFPIVGIDIVESPLQGGVIMGNLIRDLAIGVRLGVASAGIVIDGNHFGSCDIEVSDSGQRNVVGIGNIGEKTTSDVVLLPNSNGAGHGSRTLAFRSVSSDGTNRDVKLVADPDGNMNVLMDPSRLLALPPLTRIAGRPVFTQRENGALNLPQLSAAPASPTQGDTYFDDGTKKARTFNGTSWVDQAASYGRPTAGAINMDYPTRASKGSVNIMDFITDVMLTGSVDAGPALNNCANFCRNTGRLVMEVPDFSGTILVNTSVNLTGLHFKGPDEGFTNSARFRTTANINTFYANGPSTEITGIFVEHYGVGSIVSLPGSLAYRVARNNFTSSNASSSAPMVMFGGSNTFIHGNNFNNFNPNAFCIQMNRGTDDICINTSIKGNYMGGPGKGIQVLASGNYATTATGGTVGAPRARPEGLEVSDNQSIVYGGPFIEINSILNCRIMNNMMDQGPTVGCVVLAAQGTVPELGIYGVQITGNYISTAQDQSSGVGIRHFETSNYCSGIMVIGNEIGFCGVGILIGRGSNEWAIEGNIFHSIGSGDNIRTYDLNIARSLKIGDGNIFYTEPLNIDIGGNRGYIKKQSSVVYNTTNLDGNGEGYTVIPHGLAWTPDANKIQTSITLNGANATMFNMMAVAYDDTNVTVFIKGTNIVRHGNINLNMIAEI
jgi:hypothetical protein